MIKLLEGNKDAASIVIALQQQGLSSSQIYENLKKEGFTSIEIDDAINQVKLNPQFSQKEAFDEAPAPGLKPSLLDEPERKNNVQTTQESSFSDLSSGTNSYSDIQLGSFQSSRGAMDDVEALIESIIEEKWRATVERFGNLEVWKDRIKTDTASIKQELIRLEHRFENIENAVLGKISQYDKYRDASKRGTFIFIKIIFNTCYYP